MSWFPVLGLIMTAVLGAGPATQPAGRDIFIVPFTALGNDKSLEWAGKAVGQNLLTDLTRAHFQAVTSDKAIENLGDAQAAAKAVGARFLITGTYQLAEQLVRFNGQMVEVSSGKVIGGLAATGAPRDLFSLEDSLSSQAIAELAQADVPVDLKKASRPIPDSLQAPSVLDAIAPPAVAAPGTVSHYDGSALQAYVDANKTPSTDFAQQLQDASDRNIYGSFNNYGYGLGFGYGFGGLYTPYYYGGGYGLGGIYSIPFGGYYGGGFGRGFGGGSYIGHRQHIVNADR